MEIEVWYLVLGALLVAVAMLTVSMERLPLTETIVYLCAGVVLGPFVLAVVAFEAADHTHLLERLAEAAVIVSLFTAGLKLRVPLRERRWWIPLRLAVLSMTLTVGLIAALGVWALGLSLGAAVLLGAVLAPTDPVLASDVQLDDPQDRSRLKFSLTGEAGLNDGTAFPFVMLGLGLLGLHDVGSWGWRWWLIDVVWAIGGGLAIGAALGTGVGRFVLHLRRTRRESFGRDEFLALGLIGLSYGAALLAHTYGFLAVFAAGLALRLVEHEESGEDVSPDVLALETGGKEKDIATHPGTAPAHLAGSVLGFNEQVERLLEVALVLLVGLALTPASLSPAGALLAAGVFFLIRPLSVLAGLWRSRTGPVERGLVSWFGIRGIGSIYYLMYAVNQGLDPRLAETLTGFALTVVAASVIVHGLTVTPIMTRYARWSQRAEKRA